MEQMMEQILRRRMHGLYLSRWCESLEQLSRELLGLHCWFHRNVVFSAVIRGAGISGWKTALTKTWLYRGTLHGAVYEELPLLLALHGDERPLPWLGLEEAELERIADKVVMLMEDGVYSRAEMRQIFSWEYDREIVERLFSPWGGIFVYLARHGKAAFRSMTSRDFDLISAEPTLTPEQALPELLKRFLKAYGPATLADAAWFFGLDKKTAQTLSQLDLSMFSRLEHNGSVYFFDAGQEDLEEIPRLTLLSGFDPYLVSYVDRSGALPPEYKKSVILKSGICLPTIAVDGRVAGIWNLKKNEPVVEFFSPQPKRLKDAARELVEEMRWKISGQL